MEESVFMSLIGMLFTSPPSATMARKVSLCNELTVMETERVQVLMRRHPAIAATARLVQRAEGALVY